MEYNLFCQCSHRQVDSGFGYVLTVTLTCGSLDNCQYQFTLYIPSIKQLSMVTAFSIWKFQL